VRQDHRARQVVHFIRMNLFLSKFCGTSCITTFSDALASEDPRIAVYPSPAAGEFNISFAGLEGNEFTVELYDVSGKQVFFQQTALTGSIRVFSADIAALPPGIYLVKVSSARDVLIKKLVKL
jgi:hypothetical protein